MIVMTNTPHKDIADLIEALKPFADLGVGSGPGEETETYRITRDAIRNARAVIARVQPNT